MPTETIIMLGSMLVAVGSLILSSILASRAQIRSSTEGKVEQARTMQSVDRLISENQVIFQKLDANAERYVALVSDIATLKASIISIWNFLEKPINALPDKFATLDFKDENKE